MSDTVYAFNLENGKMVRIPLAISLAGKFRDLVTDTLYAASGTSIVALFASTTAYTTGTWKKRIVTENHESYAWLQVESDFLDADGVTARSVTVTIANDAGTTITTKTVSSRDPVRLPAFRERELIITVSSAAIVTEVLLASTTEELQRV